MKKYLLIFFLLIAPSAFAQSINVIPGSKPGSTSGIISLSSGNLIRTFALQDRSVYCRYRSHVASNFQFSETVACASGTCPTGRLIGDAEGGMDGNIDENDAIAFIANNNPADPALPEDNHYDITVVGISGGTNSAIIECFNTTLYGNFNTVTVANPFNFLELTNDSNIDINVRIVVTKNDGTFLSRTTISVPKDQQRDIAIHDIAGAANTFGRIMVAHDGALHGLRASLTKYTSSFAITASTPFMTRGNEQ